jgi:hypothetical protein
VGHRRNILDLHVVVAPSRTTGAAGNAGSMSPAIVIGSTEKKDELDCRDCARSGSRDSSIKNLLSIARHSDRKLEGRHASSMAIARLNSL